MEENEARLGILGGMGPQATQVFYQRVIDRTNAECDQEHVPTLIWSDALMPDRTRAILEGNADMVRDRLISSAKLLQNAGCTTIAIPCNTSHYFISQVQKEISIPVLNMIEETVRRIAKTNAKKVGILATDGTVQMGLYQEVLEKYDLKAVLPDESTQKLVMHMIYEEIKKGEIGSEEIFLKIDGAMRAKHCDYVILGCTELSVYANMHTISSYYIDAMEVLAECAITACHHTLKEDV